VWCSDAVNQYCAPISFDSNDRKYPGYSYLAICARSSTSWRAFYDRHEAQEYVSTGTKLAVGIIVAIVAGGIIFVVIVALAIFCLCCRRRRNQNKQNQMYTMVGHPNAVPPPASFPGPQNYEQRPASPSEYQSQYPPKPYDPTSHVSSPPPPAMGGAPLYGQGGAPPYDGQPQSGYGQPNYGGPAPQTQGVTGTPQYR
jgi:hypothetical protein